MAAFGRMDSKTLLLVVLSLLAVVMLAKGENEPGHDVGPRANRRYKRMYVMCPPKFSRIGNECYYIGSSKLNWLDAYFECKDHNSKLAEPLKYEDKHLRRYLQKIKLTDDLWIGGTYNWKSNKWQWGHNGRDIDYQSFSQMVPGSSRDLKFHCALLRSDLKFRWSAEECTKKINFICQHRMPLVSESGRLEMYDKWNKTYPYQKANEKMVYIMKDPNNRNRSESGKPRIYNSKKRVIQSNPSIQPHQAHRRNKKPAGTKRPYYVAQDVVVPKQQIAQYAPDGHNDINTIDNGGHRNGFPSMRFNVDIGPRNRDVSFPRGHRGQHGMTRAEPRLPHQHRHQPGMYKTTKRTGYEMAPPLLSPSRPTTTTSTTTTTTTTMTTTPRPTPDTRSYVPETTYEPQLSLSQDEKKAKLEKLRERLRKLSPEEQRFFFEDRAKRKRIRDQLRKMQQQQANEVVQ